MVRVVFVWLTKPIELWDLIRRFGWPSLFVSVNSLLVDEIVYDLLADFGYSSTDRKVLYCVYGFHFLT